MLVCDVPYAYRQHIPIKCPTMNKVSVPYCRSGSWAEVITYLGLEGISNIGAAARHLPVHICGYEKMERMFLESKSIYSVIPFAVLFSYFSPQSFIPSPHLHFTHTFSRLLKNNSERLCFSDYCHSYRITFAFFYYKSKGQFRTLLTQIEHSFNI